MTGHPDLRPLLAGDTSEAASPSVRRELLGHLRVCAACRAALAEADPTRLFVLLALDSVPPGALDRLSQNVTRAIEAQGASRRRPFRRGALAALAASLLLAVALGAYLWMREGAGPEPAIAHGPAAVSPLVTQDIELHLPREADVVSFAVGDTQLVMIFDEALGL